MRKYLTIRKTSIHIGLVLALAVLILSTALATVLLTKTISMTAIVNGSANLVIKDSLGNDITSYAWGSFDPSGIKYLGITLKNIGNKVIYVGWFISGWTKTTNYLYSPSPANRFSAYIKFADDTFYVPQAYSVLLNPQDTKDLTIGLAVLTSAWEGSEAFTLEFRCADSSSG